ncbi:hypothetical protein L1887_09479 [Cichorium endivia]|nr:hypothetical protein L1887_09479 [Cichorium endivia]
MAATRLSRIPGSYSGDVDRVFGPTTTTRHVYDIAAQHVVSGAMEGINDVPSVAITLMETLLAIDPSQRQTASSALKSERRQDRANSKSRSEYFTRNKDDTASGFPIENPRLSHYSKDSINDSEPPQPPMRESYSGPLVASSWTKSTKKYEPIYLHYPV